MPIAPPAVRAEALTKVYGSGETAVTALDAVNTQLESGEFTAIMGPSGSGKSTLMHLAGRTRPGHYGRAWVGDVELTGLDDKRLTRVRRDHIGFVFQSFNLVPTLDARENIVLPQKLAGRRPTRRGSTRSSRSSGSADRLTHRPAELSGGQQQRVAIARALVMRPDGDLRRRAHRRRSTRPPAPTCWTVLRRSVDEFGQTVVMVTHDATAASGCDRIVRLADGRIVADER
jgi:putative ABC transport system ATP-binding protein